MGQHRPETTHGRRRNRDAELGNVASQESLNEALAPGETVFVGTGKKRTRESAPEPQSFGTTRSCLLKIKAGKFNKFDSAGQGLGNILDDIRRGASQDEKPGLVFRAVD